MNGEGTGSAAPDRAAARWRPTGRTADAPVARTARSCRRRPGGRGVRVDAAVELVAADPDHHLDPVDPAEGERLARRHRQRRAVDDRPDRPAAGRIEALAAVLDQGVGRQRPQARGDVAGVGGTRSASAADLGRELRAEALPLGLVRQRRLAVRGPPDGVHGEVVVPADADAPLEQAVRGRRGDLVAHAGPARRLAEDRHIPGSPPNPAMLSLTQRNAACWSWSPKSPLCGPNA